MLLAVCSEADAFVASSLTSFSLTSRLVLLVVGPVADVKLVALQAGTFGSMVRRSFRTPHAGGGRGLRPGHRVVVALREEVFTVLGAVALVRAVRAPRSMTGGDSHDEAHAHGAVPRVSILLALPVMAVFLVAPSGLGSFAASRAAKAPVSRASGPALPLPPPRNGAVDLTLTDYAGRLGPGTPTSPM